MIYRLILPEWAKAKAGWNPAELPPTIEGELTEEDVRAWNELGYNCYFFPNYPSHFTAGTHVDGTMVDTWTCVFIDLDMKDYKNGKKGRTHDYETKDAFIKVLLESKIVPSRIIDSGGGVHAYWDIVDLIDTDYLRFQRRLARLFVTDPEVSKLCQLMRVPDTINWKDPDNLKLAEYVYVQDKIYTCEELNKALPRVTDEDEAYCVAHYEKTHGLGQKLDISDELPRKWFKLAKKGTEAHKLFYGNPRDRSAADYRLAHLMLAASFTKEEAMTVLCQTNKATERSGVHRYNYAEAIVSKVWIAITEPEVAKTFLTKTVAELLGLNPDAELRKGTRFECDPVFDATEHGFRLGQVFGEIGGVGSGKTMFGFNVFKGFAMRNPGYLHVAVSLEQPELEYAERWAKMSEGNEALLNSVHILGNYNVDGTYRHLSLEEIEDYIKDLEKHSGKKVGAVMIDHVGVLKKENRNGENQGLIDIFQYMKAFAVNTNTFLIMQSQTTREKASIGDIELDKDAAYGSTMFESFCDWVVTIWQPLKRCYDDEACPTITVFKYCKIRHKHKKKDKIKEDQRYALFMDPDTDLLRELTDEERVSMEYFNKKATQLRQRDKKSEPGRISIIDWTAKPATIKEASNGNGRNTLSRKGPGSAGKSTRVPSKP